MKIFFCLIILSFNAIALEGAITVLEAPLFHEPSVNAHVIQHLRKGDVIYLHPSIASQTEYEHLAPSADEEIQYFDASTDAYAKKYKDPFIENELYEFAPESEFYKTTDKKGRDAYVLKKHVYVYYNDEREYGEKTISPDPTDYRIEEPIPDNYPFKIEKKNYRSFLTFGFGNQTKNSYPYNENVTNEGTKVKKEINFLWSKRASFDVDNRTYWGTFATLTMFENQYTLQTRFAREQWLKLGIGPGMTYDLWRYKNRAITTLAAFQMNILNLNSISQTDGLGDSEKRLYRKISFTPKVATYYRMDKAIGVLDFIGGLSVQLESPYEMTSTRQAENPTWWQSGATDNYSVGASIDFSLFFGIQASI
ncbi:MAG: hypothetical protein JNM93_11945 [Bacteriovoracaceae bacterium]|nr:hypothetical protein [Bacteriovoracaceae bacterium]